MTFGGSAFAIIVCAVVGIGCIAGAIFLANAN
jgi:hypothetical protein